MYPFLTCLLLQVSATVNLEPTATTPPVAEAKITLFDLATKGGFLMIPILLLSMLAVYFFVERYLYIKKTTTTDPQFLRNLEQKLQADDVSGAIAYCQAAEYPVAKMLEKGLNRLGATARDIESAIEHMADIQINKMEKNLGLLSAIAAIAPMLGFLGTVVGMIHAFHNISITDNISIGIIAGGIYEKMITSGAGLIVGITAHAFHSYLNNMIDRSVGDMEIISMEFLDILHKPQR